MAAGATDRSIIDTPDFDDVVANQLRRRVLELARSWKSGGELFTGFPQSISWSLVELDRADIDRVDYINYEDWLDVSGGTRRASDAAKRIRERQTWYANLRDSIPADEIASHPNLPRLILVGAADASKLVLLEGHLRFTAFFVSGNIPERLEVFLGTSDRLHEWAFTDPDGAGVFPSPPSGCDRRPRAAVSCRLSCRVGKPHRAQTRDRRSCWSAEAEGIEPTRPREGPHRF